MSKRPSGNVPGVGSTTKQTKRIKTQQPLSGFFGTTSTKSKNQSDNATTTTSSASASSDSSSKKSSSKFTIFCDLDGVLVDFEAGIKKMFNGRSSDELPNQGMMWGAISKAPNFYSNLPWMPDGKLLWEELKKNNDEFSQINILTGVPRTNKSRAEKFAWCKKELGVRVNHLDMAGKKSAHEVVLGRRRNDVVNVITCWSKNKHLESKENHILIDDRLSLGEAWEKKGGIFIHHTGTTRTLTLLKEKGILKDEK